MAKKIALYIEDTEIKLLVSRGRKIEKWASFSLEPSLVRDGVILDEAKVAEAIRELMHLQKISEKKITVALSGLNSIFRFISLPAIPAKMMSEAIANEAARVIPMPLEEVYVSYQVISTEAEEMRIFLAAYPRASTDTLMRTLSKAGLSADNLDLAPLALARCVNEPRAVLVNAWLSNLDIVILVDRLPQVVRSMSLPGEEMTPEEKVAAVIEEFHRTVSFYNANHKDSIIDNSVPVYVCGDITQDETMWQSLNLNVMDYNVSTISPPIQAPEAFIPCQYMINVGLVLKNTVSSETDSKYSVIDFNALPEAYLPRPFSWSRVLVPVVAVVAVAGLVYVWFIIQGIGTEITSINQETTDLNAQSNKLLSEISVLKEDIAAQQELISPLPGQIESLEADISVTEDLTGVFDTTFSSFRQGLDTVSSHLPEVLDLKPDSVLLSSIDQNGGSLVLNGTAPAEVAIYDYSRDLRSSELFDGVLINSITVSTGTLEDGEEAILYQFQISVQ